nr:MAG TPA_asm: hypothetical protein [Caudoviricetes sp.]
MLTRKSADVGYNVCFKIFEHWRKGNLAIES